MNKIVRALSIGLMSLSPLIISAPVMAAPAASLYFSPSSGSLANGGTISVGVYEDSGAEPVNGAAVRINYPSNILSVSTADISNSSDWSLAAATSAGGGSIAIDRAPSPGSNLTGARLVATIKFHAVASSGTANVSYSFNASNYNCGGPPPPTPCGAGSDIISANSNRNILTSVSSGNYSIQQNPTNPPPPPSGGGTSPTSPSSRTSPSSSPTSRSSKGSSSSSSSSGKDTSPPTISGIQVVDISTKTASVTWTTSEPATSEVAYSLSSDSVYYLTAQDSNLATTHKLTFDSSSLSPGTEYHFKVKSTDAAGNAGSSEEQFFTTKGLSMLVNVVDQNKRPVPQAKVTIGDSTGVTNNDGQATLNGLKIGKSTATIEYKKSKTVTSVDVQPPTDASFSVAPDVTLSIVKPTSHIIYIVPPLVLLGLILLFFGSRARHNGGGGDSGVKDLRQFVASSTVVGSGNSANVPTAPTPSAGTSEGPSTLIKPTNTTGQL
jgi:hypothetical protein